MLQLIRLHGEMLVSIWYRASVDNTLEENSSVFSLNRMHWLPSARACGSKTLHQQNLLVLYWKCWLTQVDCIMAVKWLLLLLLLLRYLLVDVTVFCFIVYIFAKCCGSSQLVLCQFHRLQKHPVTPCPYFICYQTCDYISLFHSHYTGRPLLAGSPAPLVRNLRILRSFFTACMHFLMPSSTVRLGR